jgi:translation initiation factor IF-2
MADDRDHRAPGSGATGGREAPGRHRLAANRRARTRARRARRRSRVRSSRRPRSRRVPSASTRATVKELSAALGIPVPQIIKIMMGVGEMVTITQSLATTPSS